MKYINSALCSHRKPAEPELYQLIVVVNFNRVIYYRRLIENRLIVNIPSVGECYAEVHQLVLCSGDAIGSLSIQHEWKWIPDAIFRENPLLVQEKKWNRM